MDTPGNEILCVFGILNCIIYADTLLIWGTGTYGQFESRETNVALFFRSKSTQIPSEDAFIIVNVCSFLKIFVD